MENSETSTGTSPDGGSADAADTVKGATTGDSGALLAEIDQIRAMTPLGPKTDSAEILERARDERSGRLR